MVKFKNIEDSDVKVGSIDPNNSGIFVVREGKRKKIVQIRN
jgi:hypothetical protein